MWNLPTVFSLTRSWQGLASLNRISLAEKRRAEEEKQRAQEQQLRAEQEKQRAQEAESEIAKLKAFLQKSG